MAEMTSDWLYSESRLNLRQECLLTLLKTYGGLLKDGETAYCNKSIYGCAHDWVSQGHPDSNGIVEYYEKYYRTK